MPAIRTDPGAATQTAAQRALEDLTASGGVAAWLQRIGWSHVRAAAELGVAPSTIYRLSAEQIALTAPMARLMLILELGYRPAHRPDPPRTKRRRSRPRTTTRSADSPTDQ